MAQLDGEKLKKLQRGDLAGKLALVVCAAALAAFAALFAAGSATNNQTLNVIALAVCPAVMALGAAVAAFCYIKYSAAITKAVREYVTETFVENGKAMHPERKSLSYFIGIEGDCVAVTVNGFKERIIFNFSPLGKFTLGKKAEALSAITEKLTCTFCLMHQRGARFTSVDYREMKAAGKKPGKTVPIITDGLPDKRAMKVFLKSR